MACIIALLSTHDIGNGGDGSPSVIASGGSWTLQSAPAFPAVLNFGTLTINAAGDTVPGGDNPAIDFTATQSGVYVFQYDVGGGGACPGTGQLEVTVTEGAFAGSDVQIDVCEIDPVIDLFQLLLDNNDTINPPVTPAGSWTVQPSAPAGFNPAAGTYTPQAGDGSDVGVTYTFTYDVGITGADPSCDNCSDQSNIDITVYIEPVPGDNSTVNLCV